MSTGGPLPSSARRTAGSRGPRARERLELKRRRISTPEFDRLARAVVAGPRLLLLRWGLGLGLGHGLLRRGLLGRRQHVLGPRADLAAELVAQLDGHVDLVALGQERVEAVDELAVALEERRHARDDARRVDLLALEALHDLEKLVVDLGLVAELRLDLVQVEERVLDLGGCGGAVAREREGLRGVGARAAAVRGARSRMFLPRTRSARFPRRARARGPPGGWGSARRPSSACWRCPGPLSNACRLKAVRAQKQLSRPGARRASQLGRRDVTVLAHGTPRRAFNSRKLRAAIVSGRAFQPLGT